MFFVIFTGTHENDKTSNLFCSSWKRQLTTNRNGKRCTIFRGRKEEKFRRKKKKRKKGKKKVEKRKFN